MQICIQLLLAQTPLEPEPRSPLIPSLRPREKVLVELQLDQYVPLSLMTLLKPPQSALPLYVEYSFNIHPH